MSLELHVLSFNLHKGYHWLSRNNILEDMKRAIHEVDADIVFLQELRGEKRGEEAQLEYLADTVWQNYAYGKNAVYSDGHHGNAILSRYPVVSHQNIDLSNTRFERRGLLYVQIDVQPPEQKILHLFCTHLNLREGSRILQTEKILFTIESLVDANAPVVLAGDFNDWTQSSHQLLKAHGFREAHEEVHGSCAKTFPSFSPVLRLDRIYQRGLRCEKAGAQKLQLSDHLPLSAVLHF